MKILSLKRGDNKGKHTSDARYIVHQNQLPLSAISIDPDSKAHLSNGIKLMNWVKQCKGKKVVFLNVRSLYGHINELQLDFVNSDFICLAFTETRLTKSLDSNLIQIQGFNHVRLDRQTKKGGGLAFYIRLRQDVEWDLIGQVFPSPISRCSRL